MNPASAFKRIAGQWLVAAIMPMVLIFSGCASEPKTSGPSLTERYNTRSILVLPPIDNTLEVDASYQYLPTVTQPIAERGYYVFPVAVVDRMMRENGLPGPAEMHSVSHHKLYEIFGADAVLYLSLTDWGASYRVLDSSTRVTVQGRLIDLKSGSELWRGQETAVHSSSAGNQSGLIGLLVGALVNQIGASINDISPQVARIANSRLFGGRDDAQNRRGVLPAGPYRRAIQKTDKNARAGKRVEGAGAGNAAAKAAAENRPRPSSTPSSTLTPSASPTKASQN